MPAGGLFEDKVALYLKGLSPEARDMILRRIGRPETEAPIDPRTPADPHATGDPQDVQPAIVVPPEVLAPRTVMFEARQAFFEPFQPFVISDRLPNRQRGWLLADSFEGIWTYLVREALPREVAPWDAPRELVIKDAQRARREEMPALRAAAFQALSRIEQTARRDPKVEQKVAARLGGETAMADLRDMIRLLPRLGAIERLLGAMPPAIPAAEATEKAAAAQIASHLAGHGEEAPFVATAVLPRLGSPTSLVRIACQITGSAAVADLRRSQAAAAMIDVVLSAAERHVVRFQSAIAARGAVPELVADIRAFHDIVRGVALTLDIEEDRQWLLRLSALRTAISEPLIAAVDGVLPVMRTALLGDRFARPTEADRDDALRAAALLAAARRHRDALAVNAAVTRLWPVIDQALQTYGRPTLDKLRKAKGPEREELLHATRVFVDIAEHVHGEEYAALLRKTREKAVRGV